MINIPMNPNRAEAISHIERLNEIKDRLALSITQMAELFGVTRKSVYDWYDGAEPRFAVLNCMETLIDVLNSMLEIDLQRLKIVWNIPVSGQSFRSVFNDDKLESNSLKEKINKLSPRLVKKVSAVPKTTIQLGEAHLAEFDRLVSKNI